MSSLLTDAPAAVLAIATCPAVDGAHLTRSDDVSEMHLPLRRSVRRLEETRAVRVLGGVDVLSIRGFERRLSRAVSDSAASAQPIVLHAIPHTVDFVAMQRVAAGLSLPLFLSVHDDLSYALQGRVERRYALERFAVAWQQASGRFVISDDMGAEMCRRYGDQPYVVVTDGLDVVAPSPRPGRAGRLRVYFMGSAHLSYAANFQCLLDALIQLRDEGIDASVVIRGGLPFRVNARTVPVETLPWAQEGFPTQDFDDVDVAYMPLPFGSEHTSFVRFSMSTKMITYLGSGRPMLFHGPEASAAGRLLARSDAALFAGSLDVRRVVEALRSCGERGPAASANALKLASTQFVLSSIRERFWEPILEASALVEAAR
jgi:hypothetical protein